MDDTNRPLEGAEGAGMARHYKLGLAVIGSLLITLVVVAVVKLRGGPDDRDVALAPNKPLTTTSTKPTNPADSAKAWQANKPPSRELDKPTPVPPKPASPVIEDRTRSSSWSSPSPSKTSRARRGSSDSVEVGLLPNLGQNKNPSPSVIPPPPAAPMPEKRPSNGGPRHGASRYPDVQQMAGNNAGSTGQPSGGLASATAPWGSGPPAFGSPSPGNSNQISPSPGQAVAGSRYPSGYSDTNLSGGYGQEGHMRRGNPRDGRSGQPMAAGPQPTTGLQSSAENRYQQADHSPKMGRPYQSPDYDYSSPSERASGGQYEPPREARRHGPRPFDARVNRPARREDGKYVVQPNDSFWTISESLYGTGSYFRALAEWNRETVADQNRLRVGEALAAPAPSELEKRYPDLCPSPERNQVMRERMSAVSTGARYHGGPTYTVREGDTLYDIARYKLGAGARWTEIYDLNRDALQGDFDYLTPGMKLALPDDSSDAVTRRPDSSSRW